MNSIPKDKIYHFVAGLVIALIGGLAFGNINGLTLAVLAGVAKEIYDYCDYGGFDFKDTIATWVGGIAGYIVALLIHTL